MYSIFYYTISIYKNILKFHHLISRKSGMKEKTNKFEKSKNVILNILIEKKKKEKLKK